MIVIAIVAGIPGVIIAASNQVGQRVMHDCALPSSATRSVSRSPSRAPAPARCIADQQRHRRRAERVTNTATNITSARTTVVATMIGMLFLSWQLAPSRSRDPIFALLTRRETSGVDRKDDAGSLADSTSRRSRSGQRDPARQDDGRSDGSPTASRAIAAARRPGRQRMAGRWVTASIQTSSVMPAAVYWLGGPRQQHALMTIVAFTTLRRGSSSLSVAPRRRPRHPDLARALRRIFEYLDEPIDIRGRSKPPRRDTSSTTRSGSAFQRARRCRT
jgi:hypothetical protein